MVTRSPETQGKMICPNPHCQANSINIRYLSCNTSSRDYPSEVHVPPPYRIRLRGTASRERAWC